MMKLIQIARNIKKIPQLLSEGQVVDGPVLDELRRIHPPTCVKEQSVVVEIQEGACLRFFACRHMPLLYTIEEVIERECYTKHFMDLANGLRNGVVLDVGANIGIFSIYISSLYDCKVYAVEMDSSTFELLKSNVKINSHDCDVDCYNQAITSKRGIVGCHHAYDLVGSRVANEDQNGGKEGLSVSSTTLFDFLERLAIGHVDLLKMDCEGSEYEIILDADTNTFEKIQRISLEYHILEADSESRLEKSIVKLKQFYKNVCVEHDKIRGNLGMIFAE